MSIGNVDVKARLAAQIKTFETELAAANKQIVAYEAQIHTMEATKNARAQDLQGLQHPIALNENRINELNVARDFINSALAMIQGTLNSDAFIARRRAWAESMGREMP